jgi:hypothetical protein
MKVIEKASESTYALDVLDNRLNFRRGPKHRHVSRLDRPALPNSHSSNSPCYAALRILKRYRPRSDSRRSRVMLQPEGSQNSFTCACRSNPGCQRRESRATAIHPVAAPLGWRAIEEFGVGSMPFTMCHLRMGRRPAALHRGQRRSLLIADSTGPTLWLDIGLAARSTETVATNIWRPIF